MIPVRNFAPLRQIHCGSRSHASRSSYNRSWTRSFSQQRTTVPSNLHRRHARTIQPQVFAIARRCAFSISPTHQASPTNADSLMTHLTDLYSTAKDEFEIAAEETEKKTVYAADDREAATEALGVLKNAYEKAVRESDPETAREVQRRVGDRVRELENALKAVEEMAMED